ncbi:MAG: hypothetical protein ACRDLO_12140 [Solirubrobacterales bacterium]
MAARCLGLALIAATVVGGCGSSNDEDEIRNVIEGFVEAAKEQDAAGSCRFLSDDAVPRARCEVVFSQPQPFAGNDIAIEGIEINESQATASVNGERVELRRQGESWVISDLFSGP